MKTSDGETVPIEHIVAGMAVLSFVAESEGDWVELRPECACDKQEGCEREEVCHD